MPRIQTFNITPIIPEALRPLDALAHDLVWTWHPEVQDLFRRVDEPLWHAANHNPVALLARVSQARLEAVAADAAFLADLAAASDRLHASLHGPTWAGTSLGAERDQVLVAYFCAEYGLSESLPIYSGGLGVLAGDHVKAASDLGLPFVGVGLAYQEGYFRQYLNQDGWQQELPYDNDFRMLPMRLAHTPDGRPVHVNVAIEDRMVGVRAWEVTVGRSRVFLLDTNLAENTPDDRAITYRLYGGDRDYRCKQEIVLGMAGFYVLQALGLSPTVFHLNEGHSAFMSLARIVDLRHRLGLSFLEAREACAMTTVFTTHTPVPAGFDIFSKAQLDRFLPRIHEELGVDRGTFLRLGAHEGDKLVERGFNMAYCALRTAGLVNGVSLLHGEVSREMWQKMWPGLESDEVPIDGITNGIHTATWIAPEMRALCDAHVGHAWRDDVALADHAVSFDAVPDAEIWDTHGKLRSRLVDFVRARSKAQAERLRLSAAEIKAAGEVLDPNVLTIGFARRFATYTRATLLLRDPERLRELLTNPDRPVQIIVAGKAHPQDLPAKELIQTIVHFARDPAVRKRIAFIEEYDMGVARMLVQGVDVWLNNPRRPKEASGTSGMKVVGNGGLNLSILDGWWAEAWDGDNGWAIGRGELHEDADLGDAIEACELMDILENSVIPEFYARSAEGLPERWMARVKRSMNTLTAPFSTGRMVRDYADRFYLPASRRGRADAAHDFAEARALAASASLIYRNWGRAKVGDVLFEAPYDVNVRQEIPIRADIFLGVIPPEHVVVEVVAGQLDGMRHVTDEDVIELGPTSASEQGPGWHRYTGAWSPSHAGHAGCVLRVRTITACAAPAREIPVIFWE